MTITHGVATRCSQAAAAIVILAGTFLLAHEASRIYLSPNESACITTVKQTTETKTTAKGAEKDERREVATAPNPNLTERMLGQSGIWIARVILVLIAAFVAAALVQRALLGKFAFKAGSLEFPEIQAPPLEALSKEFAAGFQAGPAQELRAAQAAQPGAAPQNIPISPIEMTSYSVDLLRKIKEEGQADYAVINLGNGSNWLTSRLFLFAILLRRMRSVNTFVFLETHDGIERRYVGVKSPDAVHWLLASAFPWLENAFANAYMSQPNLRIFSDTGAMDPDIAAQLAQSFLANGDIRSYAAELPGNDWVRLDSGKWEHAYWLNGATVTDLLNLSPNRTSFVDLGKKKVLENEFAELGCEGPFIAKVNAEGQFLGLVDRKALLEHLAAETRLRIAVSIAYGRAESKDSVAKSAD
jgi:hypothetical protein